MQETTVEFLKINTKKKEKKTRIIELLFNKAIIIAVYALLFKRKLLKCVLANYYINYRKVISLISYIKSSNYF